MNAKGKALNFFKKPRETACFKRNRDIIEKAIDIAIRESKKEEITIIKDLVKLHTNCHTYHRIDGKDATCLDIVLKHIRDELRHLSTFSKEKGTE